MSEGRKKRYIVAHCAEGETYGEIWLTPEEAAIVAFATNPDNWVYVDGDGYGGNFIIENAEE